ncbi:DUF1295 domain-containing protein [Acidobacteria bacterium ACD]|nr:MAG: DUF1295 domain-containing protein [Acidobacteriota bacterium]MCE7956935.1 DUF1295 domain-containing protein [Acidobacteria bacterium ACB2]MDL1949816.1 DUF1295 domain-containing protein [Acidobacteria bacterium ACD]
MSPVPAEALRPFLLGWSLLAAAVFVALLFVDAPYGRHRRAGWGPAIPARAGWILMELPAVVLVPALFALSERRSDPAAAAFVLLWSLHYVHRGLLAPARLGAGASPMPLSVAALGFVFNLANGLLQGAWLFSAGPKLGAEWLLAPPFLLGIALFLAGMAVNRRADEALRGLRAPGETGYRVPRGGLFELVSCPNYLGEVVEWSGWALLTWSPSGLVFALWTAANLVPRALAHHRWYRRTFPDYPPGRKAIFPFVL